MGIIISLGVEKNEADTEIARNLVQNDGSSSQMQCSAGDAGTDLFNLKEIESSVPINWNRLSKCLLNKLEKGLIPHLRGVIWWG